MDIKAKIRERLDEAKLNKDIKFWADLIDGSTSGRDNLYDFMKRKLSYKKFLDSYNPEEYDNDKYFTQIYNKIKSTKEEVLRKQISQAFKESSFD